MAFMSKFTYGERFGCFGHEYIYWSLWMWIPIMEVMWFGVCIWVTFGIALRHTRVGRRNLWHPAVHTGVRNSGGNCWNRIRSAHIYGMFISREGVRRFHPICCKAQLSVNTAKKVIFWTLCVQARNHLGTP